MLGTMLYIHFMQENLKAVKANVANRTIVGDPALVVSLFDKRFTALQVLEEERRRKEVAQAMEAEDILARLYVEVRRISKIPVAAAED